MADSAHALEIGIIGQELHSRGMGLPDASSISGATQSVELAVPGGGANLCSLGDTLFVWRCVPKYSIFESDQHRIIPVLQIGG
jgi:hypothetical protein